jgi:hypothetical protein
LPPDPDLALPDIYAPPVGELDVFTTSADRFGRRVRPPIAERDEDRPFAASIVALARTVPALLVAGVAIGGRLVDGLLPESDFPVVLVLILVGQAFGLAVARANGLTPWVRSFALNLTTLAIVLPLLAIQASATRSPYVSTALGTARPAIIATVAAIASLAIVASAAVAAANDDDEGSALAFLPAALLVPALLGTEPSLSESEVGERLAEVFGLTGIATFVALLAPRRLKPLIGPSAMAGYFALLIILDRGPTQEPTSSEIARILDGSLVVVAIVLIVAIPVTAYGVRRVMRSVEAVERAMLFEGLPAPE